MERSSVYCSPGLYSTKEGLEKALNSHLWLMVRLCASRKWRLRQNCKLLKVYSYIHIILTPGLRLWISSLFYMCTYFGGHLNQFNDKYYAGIFLLNLIQTRILNSPVHTYSFSFSFAQFIVNTLFQFSGWNIWSLGSIDYPVSMSAEWKERKWIIYQVIFFHLDYGEC